MEFKNIDGIEWNKPPSISSTAEILLDNIYNKEEEANLEHFAMDVLKILKRLNDQGLLPAIL